MIDDIVMIALLMPFVLRMGADNLADHWEQLNAFCGSCLEILTFLCKIRIANAQLGGPPGA